jgi:acetyl esterase/lipase
MSTRSLVHPSLLPGLELMPTFAFTAEALPVYRQMMNDAMAAVPMPELPVTFHEETIEGPGGHKISLRIFTPDQRTNPAPAIYQIHGGGYVMGNAQMGDIGNRYLAVSTGAVVVAVDYRLAPETVHPGPVEDCYAGLQWLHANAKKLGVDAARIATKGESAGGGLAAGLALLARDRGGPAICKQILIYPMIDDRTGVSSEPHPHVGEFCWTAEANRFGWGALLGHAPGAAGVSPHAAAARAEDMHGLPPTFICCGALDLFIEEDIEFARRLLRAGVPTELHVYPGAYHGFDVNAGSPLVEAMGRDFTGALRSAFYG